VNVEAPARPKAERQRWTGRQSRFWYRLGVFLVGLLVRYWIRCYRVVGVENVPREHGIFLIANHTSGLDPFVLGYPVADRVPVGPGKIEIFQNPIVAYLIQKLGIFPLRRDVLDSTAVRTMVTLLRQKRIVIVFPEGGRSPSGEMQPFIPEFARLAIKLKAPLVPAGIVGARDALPIGTYLPRRNTCVTVAYGPEFDLSQFYGEKLTPEIVAEASAILETKVKEQVEVARSYKR
jgi:1-acyl-sn-glycerol-3-phosphate acyltransferase